MQAAPGYFLVGEGGVSGAEAGGQVIERGIHFAVEGFGAVEVEDLGVCGTVQAVAFGGVGFFPVGVLAGAELLDVVVECFAVFDQEVPPDGGMAGQVPLFQLLWYR